MRSAAGQARDLNDIATAHEILGGLVGTAVGAGSALVAAGMTAADLAARTRKLVATAAEAQIDVRPFWRGGGRPKVGLQVSRC